MSSELTAEQIRAAAADVLTRAGYVRGSMASDPSTDLFEDARSVVSVSVYESWRHLVGDWSSAQGALVEVMSDRLSRLTPKAWEGYLVLLTPGAVPSSARRMVSDIRYDINRVRKIVATGDDLSTLADVSAALQPVLPLAVSSVPRGSAGILERLPELLTESEISPELTRKVVEAFLKNDSMVQAIYDFEESG
jgi:hypothetical protein